MPGNYFIIFLPGTFHRFNLRRRYPAIVVPKLNNLKEDDNAEDDEKPNEDEKLEENEKAEEDEKSRKVEKAEEDEKRDKVMLLVAQDYTQDFPVKINDRILLRGPYTQDLDLQRHETVLLIAKGLGIVDLLPLALTLAERRVHDMRAKAPKISTKETEGSGLFRDLTRKVALFWWVTQSEPEDWIIDQLKRLRSLDWNNVGTPTRQNYR